MEKYFMIKTEGHVLVITIMQCPESNVVCLECDTEEEVYRLIRKMDCEITFAQPFHWRHSGQSVWRGRKADFFFVKEGAYFRRIDFKFIRWIKAEGSYCKLFMDNARELLLSFNLTEITSYLPVQDFVRVHRSYIVNINSVDSFIGNMFHHVLPFNRRDPYFHDIPDLYLPGRFHVRITDRDVTFTTFFCS